MPAVFYILGLITSVFSGFCLLSASSATAVVHTQADMFNFGLSHDTTLVVATILGFAAAIFIATGAITQAMLTPRDPS